MSVSLAKATDMYDTATLPHKWDDAAALVDTLLKAEPNAHNAYQIAKGVIKHNSIESLWFAVQATRNGVEQMPEGSTYREQW